VQDGAAAVSGVTDLDTGPPGTVRGRADLYTVSSVGTAVRTRPPRGVGDLYTVPSVATAVRALAPVRADGFHCSSSTLAIRSRDASRGNARVPRDLKMSVICFTIAGSSVTLPSAASSRYTILGCPLRSAIANAPNRPACPTIPGSTWILTFARSDSATKCISWSCITDASPTQQRSATSSTSAQTRTGADLRSNSERRASRAVTRSSTNSFVAPGWVESIARA